MEKLLKEYNTFVYHYIFFHNTYNNHLANRLEVGLVLDVIGAATLVPFFLPSFC